MTDNFDESEKNEVQEESEEINNLQGNIITQQKDPEIDSLHKRYKKGKLILKPNFQRGFVWDVAKSSRLIESALLDIPIPMIYLAEETNGKELVIDGQQRLTAFFSFIDGHFPDKKVFKLSGLKKYGEELGGKQFKQLDDKYQDKILYYQVRTITIKKESSTDLKFEIFERLNTASVGLNDQELRNCIYRGKYNNLLTELSEYKDFQELLGLETPHNRMKDVELVLRFAAFYHSHYETYRSSMKFFLNQEMDKYLNISDNDATELEKAFKHSVSIIKSMFSKQAFKKFYSGTLDDPNGYWEKKSTFNKAIFDVLMYSFAINDKRQIHNRLDSIREALIYLMSSDRDFVDAISYYTNNSSTVKIRFSKWLTTLKSIIETSENSKRCFSRKLKEELYNNDPTCAICQQRISDIDDAHIDHIVQYWKGGETIPENARLTHRFCNQSRTRKD